MQQSSDRSQSPLLNEIKVGPYQLRNRVVMSPMSRGRATCDDLPTALMAEYYGQRAGAGMIITESVQVSRQGKGYRNSPGIYSQAQMLAWSEIVEQYHQAALKAKAAGFDGIEVHAGNGFLLDQFLRDGTNQRTDRYGGSVENRCRLLLEIIEALIPVWGAQRIGVRIAPLSTYGEIHDSNPEALYSYLVERLDAYSLAYLHLTEGELLSSRDVPGLDFQALRKRFNGPVIANNCYDFDQGNHALANGRADMISFARLFAANPDLVERFRLRAPLNELDMNTLQSGQARGYTDYPTLAQILAQSAHGQTESTY